MAKNRKTRPISEVELRELVSKGWSFPEIAKSLGYANANAIKTTACALGIASGRPLRSLERTDEQLQQIVQRIARGEKLSVIARDERLERHLLRYMLQRRNLPVSAREYLARQNAEA